MISPGQAMKMPDEQAANIRCLPTVYAPCCRSEILHVEPPTRTLTRFKVGKPACVGEKVVPIQRALCL